MLKKGISFVNYTILICGLIIGVGIVCMLIMQNSLIKEDMEHLAYEELAQEVKQARRHIAFDGEQNPYIQNEFFDIEDEGELDGEIYVFLQTMSGVYMTGKVPEDCKYGVGIGLVSLKKISVGSDKYYIATRRGKNQKGSEVNSKYMICAMISVDAIRESYHSLWSKSYLFFIIIVIVFLLFALTLRRLISFPMKQLNELIQKSGENLDFTEKLKYDGFFRELQMLTEANNQLYQRIQQELERQEAYNANISHELRTPIAVMHAQCQLSRETAEKKHDEDMLKSIEVFERQTTRMKNLVDQLLQLTVLDREGVSLSVEDIDVRDVIESVCDDILYISKKNIEIKYSLQPVVIHANMNLIVIVINNLVSNAFKYSEDNSTIQISCGEEQNQIYVCIQDEGCGIEKEHLSRIFESFYREDTNRNTEGFGLGLSQALKIAEYYGGGIQVESKKNVGSSFTFFIPKQNEKK